MQRKKQKLESVTKKAQGQRADVTAAAKAKREMFAKSCSNIITSLRTKLQNMNPDQKKFARRVFRRKFLKYGKHMQKEKAGVTSDAKNQRNSISASAKTEKANIRTDYNNKYAEALKDIRKKSKMNNRQKELLKHQLKSEKEILSELKKIYESSLSEIDEKIKILLSDELTQSKIYRIEYQKSFKRSGFGYT